MPSMLDPHLAAIEDWLAAEPQLTALAILGRLTERHPDRFGPRQHSIVQRLLRGSGYAGPDPTTAPASELGNILR